MKLGELRQPESFVGWLKILCSNVVRDHIRQRQRQGSVEELLPEVEVRTDENRARLRQETAECIERLAEPDRNILENWYQGRCTLAELSNLQGLKTESGALKRLRKIFVQLRDCLEG
jgi:RNA polymerase sigma factor (sigma-70 family)